MSTRQKKSDALIRDIAQLFVTYARDDWEPILRQLAAGGDSYQQLRERIINLVAETAAARTKAKRATTKTPVKPTKTPAKTASRSGETVISWNLKSGIHTVRTKKLQELEVALDERRVLPTATMLREFYRLVGGKGELLTTSRRASVEQVVNQIATLPTDLQSTLLKDIGKLEGPAGQDDAYDRWFSLIHHDVRAGTDVEFQAFERDVRSRWLNRIANERSSLEATSYSQITFSLEPKADLSKENLIAALLRTGKRVPNPFSLVHKGTVRWQAGGCEAFLSAKASARGAGGFVRALPSGQTSLIMTLDSDAQANGLGDTYLMDMERPMVRLMGVLDTARSMADAAAFSEGQIVFHANWTGLAGRRLVFGDMRFPPETTSQRNTADYTGAISIKTFDGEADDAIKAAGSQLFGAFGVVKWPERLLRAPWR